MTTPTPQWHGGEPAPGAPRQYAPQQPHEPYGQQPQQPYAQPQPYGPSNGQPSYDPSYGGQPSHAAGQPGGQGHYAPGQPSYPALPAEGPSTVRMPVVTDEPPQAASAPGAVPSAARRTGSPIIAPGIQPALITAVLAALTAATAAVGRPALAVAAVALQAVTAAGWFRLNGMWPARQGIALAFLAGLTADVALLLAPADRAPTAVLGTLGVWIPLILVQQMRHHGSADERLSSLTATAASTVLAVLAAGYLAEGGHPVVVGALAVGVATLLRALPLPSALSVATALLAAAASGAGTAHLTGMPVTSGVAIAAAAGLCAIVGLRVASYDFPSRFVHFTAGVALPLALAAPVVWTVAQALGR